MKAGRASSTAGVVASGVLFVHHEPGLGHLVSKEAAEAILRLLRARSPLKAAILAGGLPHAWFRLILRFVENRIRITRDLEEQQALRSGLDLTSLSELGFQAPDPARVVDVTLASPRARWAGPGLGARLLGALRRAVPSFLTERVVGLPAAPVEAGGTR